ASPSRFFAAENRRWSDSTIRGWVSGCGNRPRIFCALVKGDYPGLDYFFPATFASVAEVSLDPISAVARFYPGEWSGIWFSAPTEEPQDVVAVQRNDAGFDGAICGD